MWLHTSTQRNAEFYKNRGIAKSELRQYIDAISDFDTAIRLKPTDAGAYYACGLTKGMLELFQDDKQDLLIALNLAEQEGNVDLIDEIEQDLY